MFFPLSREVSEDEYPALGRMVAKELGIDLFDDTTYEPCRLLPQIIMGLIKAIPTIITSIVEAFGKGLSKFVEIGGQLISGLWEGIKNAGSWLWDKITGFFGGIVDGIVCLKSG